MKITFHALASLFVFAFSAGVIAAVPDRHHLSTVEKSSQRSVEVIIATIHEHNFHPVDKDSFTIDRHLETHGIADLEDEDWKVRLLAIRDLVQAGNDAVSSIIRGLAHEDVQVRYVAAVSLGILGHDSATQALQEIALNDPDALARSAAVVALGQIGDDSALDRLRVIAANDPSKDVRHQAGLAIDQISKSMGSTDALRSAFRSLDPATFGRVEPGRTAPDFRLPDTEGQPWPLELALDGEHWVVSIGSINPLFAELQQYPEPCPAGV